MLPIHSSLFILPILFGFPYLAVKPSLYTFGFPSLAIKFSFFTSSIVFQLSPISDQYRFLISRLFLLQGFADDALASASALHWIRISDSRLGFASGLDTLLRPTGCRRLLLRLDIRTTCVALERIMGSAHYVVRALTNIYGSSALNMTRTLVRRNDLLHTSCSHFLTCLKTFALHSFAFGRCRYWQLISRVTIHLHVIWRRHRWFCRYRFRKHNRFRGECI